MTDTPDKSIVAAHPELLFKYAIDVRDGQREEEGLPGTEAFLTPLLLQLLGIPGMMAEFEAGFQRYLGKVTGEAMEAFGRIVGRHGPDWLEGGIGAAVLGKIQDIPGTESYSSHLACLNSAWTAADELRDLYDIKMGIARKGLWLSYIFSLAGWEDGNILSLRLNGEFERINMLISPHPDSISGKRILLLDNDMLSGESVDTVARSMQELCGASEVGVLTVYGHCSLSVDEFEKSGLGPERVLGRKMEYQAMSRDFHVVDADLHENVYMSLPAKLPHVSRMHHVEQFRPEFKAFGQVGRRLARAR